MTEIAHRADIYTKANEAFYRAVTGGWHEFKLTTVTGYLRSDGLPEDVIDKTTTAIVDAQNLKDGILSGWQNRINRWHEEGTPDKCADLGDKIRADVDAAIVPLAPFATEIQASVDEIVAHLPPQLQEELTCQS